MCAETDYMYMWIRKDLSPPQMIVQASHAAAKIGEAYHGETSIVLFEAEHENHLDEISMFLAEKGIDHRLFYEPDINACTAIATAPVIGNQRKAFKKFKLLQ